MCFNSQLKHILAPWEHCIHSNNMCFCDTSFHTVSNSCVELGEQESELGDEAWSGAVLKVWQCLSVGLCV